MSNQEKQATAIVILEPISATFRAAMDLVKGQNNGIEFYFAPTPQEAIQLVRQHSTCVVGISFEGPESFVGHIPFLRAIGDKLDSKEVKVIATNKVTAPKFREALDKLKLASVVHEPISNRTLMFKIILQIKAVDVIRKQQERSKQDNVSFKASKAKEQGSEDTIRISTNRKPKEQEKFLLQGQKIKQREAKAIDGSLEESIVWSSVTTDQLKGKSDFVRNPQEQLSRASRVAAILRSQDPASGSEEAKETLLDDGAKNVVGVRPGRNSGVIPVADPHSKDRERGRRQTSQDATAEDKDARVAAGDSSESGAGDTRKARLRGLNDYGADPRKPAVAKRHDARVEEPTDLNGKSNQTGGDAVRATNGKSARERLRELDEKNARRRDPEGNPGSGEEEKYEEDGPAEEVLRREDGEKIRARAERRKRAREAARRSALAELKENESADSGIEEDSLLGDGKDSDLEGEDEAGAGDGGLPVREKKAREPQERAAKEKKRKSQAADSASGGPEEFAGGPDESENSPEAEEEAGAGKRAQLFSEPEREKSVRDGRRASEESEEFPLESSDEAPEAPDEEPGKALSAREKLREDAKAAARRNLLSEVKETAEEEATPVESSVRAGEEINEDSIDGSDQIPEPESEKQPVLDASTSGEPAPDTWSGDPEAENTNGRGLNYRPSDFAEDEVAWAAKNENRPEEEASSGRDEIYTYRKKSEVTPRDGSWVKIGSYFAYLPKQVESQGLKSAADILPFCFCQGPTRPKNEGERWRFSTDKISLVDELRAIPEPILRFLSKFLSKKQTAEPQAAEEAESSQESRAELAIRSRLEAAGALAEKKARLEEAKKAKALADLMAQVENKEKSREAPLPFPEEEKAKKRFLSAEIDESTDVSAPLPSSSAAPTVEEKKSTSSSEAVESTGKEKELAKDVADTKGQISSPEQAVPKKDRALAEEALAEGERARRESMAGTGPLLGNQPEGPITQGDPDEREVEPDPFKNNTDPSLTNNAGTESKSATTAQTREYPMIRHAGDAAKIAPPEATTAGQELSSVPLSAAAEEPPEKKENQDTSRTELQEGTDLLRKPVADSPLPGPGESNGPPVKVSPLGSAPISREGESLPGLSGVPLHSGTGVQGKSTSESESVASKSSDSSSARTSMPSPEPLLGSTPGEEKIADGGPNRRSGDDLASVLAAQTLPVKADPEDSVTPEQRSWPVNTGPLPSVEELKRRTPVYSPQVKGSRAEQVARGLADGLASASPRSKAQELARRLAQTNLLNQDEKILNMIHLLAKHVRELAPSLALAMVEISPSGKITPLHGSIPVGTELEARRGADRFWLLNASAGGERPRIGLLSWPKDENRPFSRAEADILLRVGQLSKDNLLAA